MKISTIICIIVLAGFGLCSGKEYPCTYTSKAGDYYDLSPLSICDHTGYQVPTTDENFVINICNTVTGCGGNSGACQGSSYSTGQPSSATWSDAPSGKGLVLTYGNGDSNGCSSPRKTVFTFTCDESRTTPLFQFTNENPQCTYNFKVASKAACPTTKAPQINLCPIYVHLVPHTHDDVGWLETIQGYYTSQVKHILDTVVSSLVADPQRKFIYVEQAFFTLWWNDATTTDQQRNNLRNLVKNGQFEFVIGGWVMQDEACTTYGADIDQMTQGHQFLLNTFGVTPTKGWQLDPFGASTVTATLNKLAGFDAHLIDRITNKAPYETAQRLEFIWNPSPSLGKKAEIFTNIMDGGGAGYCDWLSSFNFQNDPVNSGNVATYGNNFINMATQRAAHVRTPHMLAAWGCDFAFQNATAMFNSMDKVVAWLQSQEATTGVFVKYSTVSEYFAAEMGTPNIQWPVNDASDFFPYLDRLWWTGYYTSRVQLKGIVRQGEATARAVEPLYALNRATAKADPSIYKQLDTLRVANADAQHHDGVTGTSEPPVVLMYGDDIQNGMNAANDVQGRLISGLLGNGTATLKLSTNLGNILNFGANDQIAIVLYNPLGWTRNDFVVIPTNNRNIMVVDKKGAATGTAIWRRNMDKGAKSTWLLHLSVTIGPLGFKTVYLKASTNNVVPGPPMTITPAPGVADVIIENSFLSVTISGTSGLISKVTNKKTNVNIAFNQNVEWYMSQSSGAYAFGPNGGSRRLSTAPPTLTVDAAGTSVYQTFPCADASASYAKQTISLYNNKGFADSENFIEFMYELGPLPSSHEIVATFNTSIFSNGAFSSDDNGYEFQSRAYNYQVPIEGNYYPMVYAAEIHDLYSQLSLVGERSRGVASLGNGRIEVMLHRNPDMSDNFGPGLTDTTTVYPAVRALVDTPQNSPQVIHKQTYLMNFPTVVLQQSCTGGCSTWGGVEQLNLLSADLPPNVHLLALNALDNNSKKSILRLTHLFAIDDDPKFSQPVTVDLAKLLSGVKIASFQETTLTANKVIDSKASTTVTISPKDIRTFIIEFA